MFPAMSVPLRRLFFSKIAERTVGQHRPPRFDETGQIVYRRCAVGVADDERFRNEQPIKAIDIRQDAVPIRKRIKEGGREFVDSPAIRLDHACFRAARTTRA